MNQKIPITVNSIIKFKNFLWCLKVFTYSIILASFLTLAVYITMMVFADPSSVSGIIKEITSAAHSKINKSSDYVGLTWSIFLFNSLAAVAVSAGTGFFVYFNRFLIKDIASRRKNSNYAKVAIAMEKGLYPISRISEWLAEHFFGFKPEKKETQKKSFWKYTSYSKYHFRLKTAINPFVIPFLLPSANGALIGILFVFHMFNGALSGYQLAEFNGAMANLVFNLIYFASAILPHGILEIPVMLISGSIGYTIADSNCRLIRDQKLFYSDNIQEIEADISKGEKNTGTILFSSMFCKVLVVIVLLLLVAAFIETKITPIVISRVAGIMDPFI